MRANPTILNTLLNIYNDEKIREKDMLPQEYAVIQYLRKLDFIEVNKHHYQFTKLGNKFGNQYFRLARKEKHYTTLELFFNAPIIKAVLYFLLYMALAMISVPIISIFATLTLKLETFIFGLGIPIFMVSAIIISDNYTNANEFTLHDLNKFLKDNLDTKEIKHIQYDKDYQTFKLLLFQHSDN